MLAGFTWLLVFQCAGEFIARFLQLPVPGPVLGMMLLFVALRLRGRAAAPLEQASGYLLQHLSLLFVPAGVGVVAYAALLESEWRAILAALVVSTVLAIGVTAWSMSWLLRRDGPAAEASREDAD